jgi:hypothetical protein
LKSGHISIIAELWIDVKPEEGLETTGAKDGLAREGCGNRVETGDRRGGRRQDDGMGGRESGSGEEVSELAITGDEEVAGTSGERHGKFHDFGELAVVIRQAHEDGAAVRFFEGREHFVVALADAIDHDLEEGWIEAGGFRGGQVAIEESESQNAGFGDQQDGVRGAKNERPFGGVNETGVHDHEIESLGSHLDNASEGLDGDRLALHGVERSVGGPGKDIDAGFVLDGQAGQEFGVETGYALESVEEREAWSKIEHQRDLAEGAGIVEKSDAFFCGLGELYAEVQSHGAGADAAFGTGYDENARAFGERSLVSDSHVENIGGKRKER